MKGRAIMVGSLVAGGRGLLCGFGGASLVDF